MFFQLLAADKKPSNPSFVFHILIISSVLIISHGSIAAAAAAAAAARTKITKIGAIVDDNSRIGKEQKVAMEIAVQNFNNISTHHKLSLHVQNPGRDPLQAAYAADELIKEKQVQVMVGMERWHQAALVADVGSRAQVPVLSLAAAAVTPPSPALRWPFLVQMATNASQQVNCIAAIISSYNWKRVIAIYEDDIYSGDSGMVALLSEALQSSGSEIEHRLAFPPFSSLSDPEGLVLKEVSGLLKKQSRVFIVLKSSVLLATRLFREAEELGLMGRDSVWIITDTISSVLEPVDNSFVSSMQGALGIETYFSEDSASFLDFKGKFQKQFRLDYPEEDNSRPGIHALRAYDSINTIAQALQRTGTGSNVTSKMLLENILSSNFNGLSGDIVFADGELSQLSAFRIVNVIRKTYNELGFWSSEIGFWGEFTDISGSEDMKMVFDSVTWPGKLKSVPKGWAMPTNKSSMKIVVPGTPVFEKFLKVDWKNSPGVKPKPSGFCIELFLKSVESLDYELPYEFHPVNGTYDELVYSVFNKTYDAVVGDLTIIANRSEYVEFTQPYIESGLLMIVPVKSDEDKAWIFMKPFSTELWLVTGIIMIYTTSIVWLLEHHSNPEFGYTWKNQFSTTLWFTFSTLFFAHREQIKGNYTRVVVVVWLLVVLVVTSSYQASLTSILTVKRLDPNVTDVDWLRRNDAMVGCDNGSFAKNYLKDVLQFKDKNIITIDSEQKYTDEFENGKIKAAFFEVPYAKSFLKQHCNKYTSAGPVYRLGGWGFAFQKGSPIANDLSNAILSMSEKGVLKELEEGVFNASSGCSNADSTTNADRLDPQNFLGLFVISVSISTICFLLFLVSLLRKYRSQIQENQNNVSPGSNNSIWRKMVRFVRYFHNGGGITSAAVGSAPTPSSDRSKNGHEWELASPSEISEHVDARTSEIEIPVRTG